MRGISEERLREIVQDYPADHRNHKMAKFLITTECRELQKSRMTLDEFLKSGFEGLCWLKFKNGDVDYGSTSKDIDGELTFCDRYNIGIWDETEIIEVIPIHKPEMPR